MTRSDYAMCGGDHSDAGQFGGPVSLVEGDQATYMWPDTSQANGVCFLRSEVRWRDVTDGMSSVYLLGEKHVSVDSYATYSDAGYDQSPYSGSDIDLERWGELPPLQDGTPIEFTSFGSAHPGLVHMALCDGSVRAISLNIDFTTHKRLSNRADDHPVNTNF